MFEVAQYLNVHKPIPTNTYAKYFYSTLWQSLVRRNFIGNIINPQYFNISKRLRKKGPPSKTTGKNPTAIDVGELQTAVTPVLSQQGFRFDDPIPLLSIKLI